MVISLSMMMLLVSFFNSYQRISDHVELFNCQFFKGKAIMREIKTFHAANR